MPLPFSIRNEWKLDTPNRRLVFALAVSLLVHVFGYGAWRVSPAVQRLTQAIVDRVLPRTAPPQSQAELERRTPSAVIFVEVDPAAASAEEPKEAKNYSTLNSLAANPVAQPDTTKPKLDGSDERMMRNVGGKKSKSAPLQPSPPEPAETKGAPKESEPKKPEATGDLAQKSPTTANAAETAPTKPRERPRLLAQVDPALAQRSAAQ